MGYLTSVGERDLSGILNESLRGELSGILNGISEVEIKWDT